MHTHTNAHTNTRIYIYVDSKHVDMLCVCLFDSECKLHTECLF